MRCCVPFCINTPDDIVSPSARKGISFHCLPSDKCLHAAWLKALCIQDSPLPDTAVVCSQHFLDDDIYETENGLLQICAGSVPSTVQVCMICLDTDSKLLLMSKYKLDEAYEKLIGHPVCDQGNLKQTLCVQCAQRLINFSSFRDKSLRACALMTNLVEKHEIITREHIKMINHTKNQLYSHFEVKILGPDHCDLYIIEDASEDNKTELFPSLFTVNNEERYDSLADEDTEMANEDDNNAGIIKNEFNASNEDLLSVDSIMWETIVPDAAVGKGLERNRAVAEQVTETIDPLKWESVPLECTLCSEEFVGEHAYLQHMHIHGQNSDEYAFCGTSPVFKPHTVVTSSHSSRLTENKQVIQELNNDLHPSADSAETFVSPLPVRFVTDNENKGQAEEANMIQKSIKEIKVKKEELDSLSFDLSNISRLTKCAVQLYDIIKKPIKSVPIQDKPLTEKPYSCELCKLKYKFKCTLVKHMRTTHKGLKPYSCELCEYKSKYKRNLVRHMRKHNGGKPYSCELCEYKSKHKRDLKIHMRTHTGEKPYTCELCGYKCTLNSHLVRHMRTHTGEKPYTCELCEYKCTVNSNLVSHMRTHTGEKPFSCELCEYKCKHKHTLVRHMRSHTGEKPYSCKL